MTLEWTNTETHGIHLFVPVKAQTACAVCGFAKGHHPNVKNFRRAQREDARIALTGAEATS